jgi:hypothetical protein
MVKMIRLRIGAGIAVTDKLRNDQRNHKVEALQFYIYSNAVLCCIVLYCIVLYCILSNVFLSLYQKVDM